MSKIEWTGETWNPLSGCDEISPGCTNCYAAVMAHRLEAMGMAKYAGTTRKMPNGKVTWTGKINLDDAALTKPLRKKAATTYFVNSMSDLFHDDVPEAFIDRVFAVMALCPQHTFQVLTKRAARMRDYMADAADLLKQTRWEAAAVELAKSPCAAGIVDDRHFPLSNVWLGVSVEDQQRADERIPLLLQTPAAIRFLSCEPLLGKLKLAGYLLNGIHWVIVGGESGPGARPCEMSWIRPIIAQCKSTNVACFMKQVGAYVVDRNDAGFEAENETWAEGPDEGKPTDPLAWPTPLDIEDNIRGFQEIYQGAPVRVRLRNRKGGTMEEWPMDIRVRQMPKVKVKA